MTSHTEAAETGSGTSKLARDERLFFDLVGPALQNENLLFLCAQRSYPFGSGPDRTVVRVHDFTVFRKVLTQGNLGLGEAYINGGIEIVRGTLEEFLASLIRSDLEASILDNPDNITVARDGTLYLCEDGGGSQFVVGIDRRGGAFRLLSNGLDRSEFAGACFSADNRFFFVNTQGLGITFAIFRADRRPIVLKRAHA